MKEFQISFIWEGSRYCESITAFTLTAARKAILSRFPGATCLSLRQVG